MKSRVTQGVIMSKVSSKVHRQPTRQLMHRYEQPEKLTDQQEILMRLEDLYIKMDQILIHLLEIDEGEIEELG